LPDDKVHDGPAQWGKLSQKELKHYGTNCIYCWNFFHVSFYRQQRSNALESASNQRSTFLQQAEYYSGQYRQSGLLGLRGEFARGPHLLSALFLHNHQPDHAGTAYSEQLQAKKQAVMV
jgi:hypothetical protein